MKRVLFSFLIAVFGGAAALGINNFIQGNQSAERLINERVPAQFASEVSRAENAPDLTQAAESSVHGVVHVKTVSSNSNVSNDPFYDFFFGSPYRNMPQQKSTASGSGVIISEDGYIVTNNHVVANAEKVSIVLNDKREFTAEVIGKDPTTDLALLKIKANGLPYLYYGNSDQVKVGEWVLAVGNPFSLTSTVTAGIISAKGRNINILNEKFAIESFLQTDAAVNPGNSGGALVNTKGELVGINAAIASNTGSYSGYSFAIPVNMVRKVVADLLEFGEVQRAFLGVSIKDLNAELAAQKGITDLKGVYVAGLNEGGAAIEAGLKEGDIIISVGEVAVNNTPELQEQIARFRPGDKVKLGIRRGSETKEVQLELKNRNGDTRVIKQSEALVNDLGADFEPVNDKEKARLGIQGGLKIVKLKEGRLRTIGIKQGFIITHIGEKQVQDVEDLGALLKTTRRGLLIEGVYPNGARAYYGMGL
ncbi:MAG: Do family serine endopeptidase [Bacteroidia bacterium]|nr:Do family serine endopeptidase [Bacteroidia bacterium]